MTSDENLRMGRGMTSIIAGWAPSGMPGGDYEFRSEQGAVVRISGPGATAMLRNIRDEMARKDVALGVADSVLRNHNLSGVLIAGSAGPTIGQVIDRARSGPRR